MGHKGGKIHEYRTGASTKLDKSNKLVLRTKIMNLDPVITEKIFSMTTDRDNRKINYRWC